MERATDFGVLGLVDDSPETRLALYRTMLLVRRFEEASQALFLRGLIAGSIHLGMGQEAVATGVCAALEPDDAVAATYRGHAAALALGTEPAALLAEMLGRTTGVCGGLGGSMNVVDREHGLLGCFGIVGGSIGAATGAALSFRGGSAVAVAFFGDGAVNQGYFHECLNFAAVNALPVVYVCENNGYGEFTPTGAVTAGAILDRPRALGLRTEAVDGQDVFAVRAAAAAAIEHARSGRGPAFLEAATYRYNDHARGDPIDYRAPGELARWRERDPLSVAAAALELGEEELEGMAAEVAASLDEARASALADPVPDADVLERLTEFAAA